MRALATYPHSRQGAAPSSSSVPVGRLARLRRAAADLTPQAIEQIAQRVAQLLGHAAASSIGAAMEDTKLLSASEVANRLGVARAWVYEHAVELGARRLGSGPRARLRFDLAAGLASDPL